MKKRYLVFLILTLLCMTVDGFAQSKRPARKRPANKQTVVKKTKQEAEPATKTVVAEPKAETKTEVKPEQKIGQKAEPVIETKAEPKAENKPVTLPAKGGAPVVVVPVKDTVAAPAPVVIPQDRVDTIYYNKNWKVTTNKAFANYYRLALYPVNPAMQKEFKTYYITGELQAEGSFLELDKSDDANSRFADQYVSYFKDGQVEETKSYRDGRLHGEYTVYYHNGSISKHFTMNDGMRDGLYASFTEDGRVCTLTPYKANSPEGFYVVVDADGNYSKYSLIDNKPIMETPTLEEMSSEYKNGVAWSYYNKNGLIVGACNSIINTVGDYREVGLYVVNKSMVNVDLDPRQIQVYTMKGDKYKVYEMVSVDEYNDKIRKYARKNNYAVGNVRETSVNTNLGAQVYNAGTSNTLKEFQKRICRMRELDESTRMQSTDKQPLDLGYLERTTIHPGEAVTGYLYTSDKKAADLYIRIKINGIEYLFNWKEGKKR